MNLIIACLDLSVRIQERGALVLRLKPDLQIVAKWVCVEAYASTHTHFAYLSHLNKFIIEGLS